VIEEWHIATSHRTLAMSNGSLQARGRAMMDPSHEVPYLNGRIGWRPKASTGSRPWTTESNWEAEYMKPWYRLEADRNLLLVAGYNLVRAVDFLNPPSTEDTSALDAIRSLGPKLKTLRDCVEHWDEATIEWMQRRPTRKSGEAYRELAKIAPDADMETYTWSESGDVAVIAGVLDIRSLHEAAQHAREYFRALDQGWYVHDGWS
jgi:hypothetical protein